jgi:hypothetical protein
MALVFPQLKARNLLGKDVELPEAFEGDPSVVMVAFRRGQQRQVDSWVPWLEGQAERCPNLRFYELPALARMWTPFRASIDGGMATAINDPIVLARTLTIYGNLSLVTGPLEIRRRSTISLFLVERGGSISWRGEGAFDEAAAKELSALFEGR